MERGLQSRTVLGSMLGAPTYQLRDLGQINSFLCLSLLACETKTQRQSKRARVEPRCAGLVCNGAESAVSGAPTPTQTGDARITVTNTNSRRPPAARPASAPLHDSPGPA